MGISLFQKSLRDMISGMRSNRNNEVSVTVFFYQ